MRFAPAISTSSTAMASASRVTAAVRCFRGHNRIANRARTHQELPGTIRGLLEAGPTAGAAGRGRPRLSLIRLMIDIADVSQLRAHLGRELAASDWLIVTQERIALFADATGDHQWIHLDGERARESPYKTTIAHGFLSLSLISTLVKNAVSIAGVNHAINYGLNRVRFVSAVPAGARIRARVTPASMEEIDGGYVQVLWNVIVDREGSEKPCLAAEWLVRYHVGRGPA